jgi:ankyrin repeat protein
MNGCELFVQFAMNPALELWKINYCESRDHKRCARFQASLRGTPIPLTLLPNGKSINANADDDEIGAASLFNAIIKHQTHMIHSLLRVGINLNVKNIEGITPLMAAVQFGYQDIVAILLERGAKPNMTNSDGETAFDIAMSKGHYDIARLINPRADVPVTPPPAAAATPTARAEKAAVTTGARQQHKPLKTA